MVGSQQTIECRVDTVPGVTTVSINWTGPRGVTIMNSSRMSISPTTSNGTVFTSILQFEYLAETDNGTYTCNWTILENSGSMSVQIQSLTGKMLKTFNIYSRTCLKRYSNLRTQYIKLLCKGQNLWPWQYHGSTISPLEYKPSL